MQQPMSSVIYRSSVYRSPITSHSSINVFFIPNNQVYIKEQCDCFLTV